MKTEKQTMIDVITQQVDHLNALIELAKSNGVKVNITIPSPNCSRVQPAIKAEYSDYIKAENEV